MADQVQTAANVGIAEQSVPIDKVQAGAAITQGMMVYSNTADSGKYAPGDATTTAKSAIKGMAISPCADDGWFVIGKSGEMDPGFTATEGVAYYLSATADGGNISNALPTTGNKVTYLGTGNSSGNIDFKIDATDADVQ